MRVLYDTSGVHPLDRFSYYREAVAGEFAPVAVPGRSPGQFSAAMAVGQLGDVTIETSTWVSEGMIEARRTDRLIRAYDPDCLRLLTSVHGGMQTLQNDHTVDLRPGDVALYDTSRPFRSRLLPSNRPMREIMLTFPRTLLSGAAGIDQHVGTVFPRHLTGRSVTADLMVELTRPRSWLADHLEVTDVLRECAVGLVRVWLGQSPGVPAQTRRLLHLARVRAVIRDRLSEPTLDPQQIARAAHMSPRYLHKILCDRGTTPMRLVKQLRLEQCWQSLVDPAMAGKSIKDIASAAGYRRMDQFAHDFRQTFGVSAKDVRP
jgi:AraC-like DNA-binding protein